MIWFEFVVFNAFMTLFYALNLKYIKNSKHLSRVMLNISQYIFYDFCT